MERWTDKLSMAKIEAGFLPCATIEDMMQSARADLERANRTFDLVERIASGEFVPRQGFITDDGLVVCDRCNHPADLPYMPEAGDDWCSVCDADVECHVPVSAP